MKSDNEVLFSNLNFLAHTSSETTVGEENLSQIELNCHTETEIEISSVPEDSTITVEVNNEERMSLDIFSYIYIVVSIIIEEF